MNRANNLFKGLAASAVLAIAGATVAQVTVDTAVLSGDAKNDGETLVVRVSVDSNTATPPANTAWVVAGASFTVIYDEADLTYVGVAGVDPDAAGPEFGTSASAAPTTTTVAGTVVSRRISVIAANDPDSVAALTPDLADITFTINSGASRPFSISIDEDPTTASDLPYTVWDTTVTTSPVLVNLGNYTVTAGPNSPEFAETGTTNLSVTDWSAID